MVLLGDSSVSGCGKGAGLSVWLNLWRPVWLLVVVGSLLRPHLIATKEVGNGGSGGVLERTTFKVAGNDVAAVVAALHWLLLLLPLLLVLLLVVVVVVWWLVWLLLFLVRVVVVVQVLDRVASSRYAPWWLPNVRSTGTLFMPLQTTTMIPDTVWVL